MTDRPHTSATEFLAWFYEHNDVDETWLRQEAQARKHWQPTDDRVRRVRKMAKLFGLRLSYRGGGLWLLAPLRSFSDIEDELFNRLDLETEKMPGWLQKHYANWLAIQALDYDFTRPKLIKPSKKEEVDE